ncbi:MAG: sodium:proton antiporter [Ignavibacteriales bacterium]|nr:MAG: sodium:proton antiporter [Ignavibacteriales bacterium]
MFEASLHSDILILLFQLFLLLLFARVFGELFQRMGQPTVVGEILAGVVLGPSLLGATPFFSDLMIVQSTNGTNLLEVVSLMGAMLLLLITGLETDLALIKHHSRSAFGTAIGGLILPLILGFGFCFLIPDSLLVDPAQRIVFSLFLATSISVSAIPVIAKVLIDLNLIRRDIGQITIAAGMIDDTAAWILLSIVLGLIEFGVVTAQNVLFSVGKVLLFLSVSFVAGKWIAAKVVSFAQNSIKSRYKFLTILILFSFGFGAIAQSLRLEAVLGAFVAGIIFSRIPAVPKEAIERIESFTFGIFAPIFFAAAGLKVSLEPLLNPELLIIGIGLIVIATLSKVAGAYIGARWVGRSDHWTALSFGAGLNARGAIQIIVATIGLSFGIISQEIFSLIIIMAVVTSIMAPFMLRYTLKKVKPKDEEIARLKQEELHKDNFMSSVHRVLLPVRKRDDFEKKLIEAKIIKKLAQNRELDLTLLTITDAQNKNECALFLDELAKLFTNISVTKKVIVSSNAIESILDEASKSYNLILIGATEKDKTSKMIFNPVVDNIVRLSSCPSIVVQSGFHSDSWQPDRILVPTNGSLAARRAAQVAFALASDISQEVHIIKVIEEKEDIYNLDMEGSIKERQFTFAYQITEELKKLGESLSVNTFSEVEIGTDTESVILEMAKEKNFDLIVLGTDIRPGSEKLYIGPRVERVLNNAPCPVLLVNSQ